MIKLKQDTEYKEEPVDSPESPPDKKEEFLSKIKNPKIALIVGASVIGLLIIVVLVQSFVPRGVSKTQLEGIAAEVEASGVDSDFSTALSYTESEIETLRAAGYTGNEIEKEAARGTPVQTLLDKAEAARTEYLKTLYVELSEKAQNSGSAEYKTLMNNTWLSGRVRTVPKGTEDDAYVADVQRDNCTYVKLPPRGNQLFLKLTMSDGTTTFFNIPPDRYSSLPDKGNMVVEYTVANYLNEKFIIGVKEVPIWEDG